MRIGLFDHMGYGNLGDAATQDALIENIKKRIPEADIIGFSLNPDDTSRRHSIPCYPIRNWYPGRSRSAQATTGATTLRSRVKSTLKKLPVVSKTGQYALHFVREMAHLVRSFSVLKSLDSLIIAGGGQLGELWRGPWSHPYNVFKFAILTKLAHRKLLFLNVGAGPLNRPLSRLFVGCAIRLADYVSFRDVESQTLVSRLGVKRETHVFPDCVYALDLPDCEINVNHSSKPLVGLNPIGFQDPRIWPTKDSAAYNRYLDSLASFSLWLVGHGYALRVFSAEKSVDLYALEDLRNRLSDHLPAETVEIIFQPPSENVKDLLLEMSHFDFVVTSKFHGVVFSHRLAKPVIALSYHNKIDDLMRAAGHGTDCMHIADFDAESLRARFLSLVHDTQGIKSSFRKTSASYAASLRVQFDEVFCRENLQSKSRALEIANDRTILSRSL